MLAWDEPFEARCDRWVRQLCDLAAAPAERDRAWRDLLTAISPHIERWASGSPLLRRCRLAEPDDARAVLVAVLGRLRHHDFANLRAYLARQPVGGDDPAETDVTETLLGIVGEDDAEAPRSEPARVAGPPFRSWLFGLVRFASKDHVKLRLGWVAARTDGPTKRALGTDAARLDDAAEPAARPPITDLLTMRRVLDEVRGYIGEFPAAMRTALELWLHDVSFDEIAAQLGLSGGDAARALVRSAQARLRHRFRDTFPTLG